MRYPHFITLSIGLFVSFATCSGDLKDAFDVYTSVPATQYQGVSMKGVVGGSFHARNNQLYNRDVYSVQFPSFEAGCGGIDAFSGAFSLITKDEIVQMARGIAQGAPGYFFNLAVDTVCPDCAANMKELSKRLNSYNNMTRDACNKFWDSAVDMSGAKTELQTFRDGQVSKVDNLFTSIGSNLDSAESYFSDLSTPSTNGAVPNDVTTAQAKEMNEINAVFDLFNLITDDFDDVLSIDYEPYELFMSLFGQAAVNVVDGATGPDVKRTIKLPTVTVKDLLFGNEADVITMTTCNLSTDPLCLEPVAKIISWEGLIPKYQKLIYNTDIANLGMINRMAMGQTLPADQDMFKRAYPYNYEDYAKKCYFGAAESVSQHLASQAAIETVRSVLINMQQESIVNIANNPLPDGTIITPDDLTKLIDNVITQFESERKASDKRVSDGIGAISVQLSFNRC